ncbi:MAG: hypothetical protein ACRD2H_16425 [Terriglobales bacterium]
MTVRQPSAPERPVRPRPARATAAIAKEIGPPRRPGRRIAGISALLLPYRSDGAIDEAGFRRHLRRTRAAGLRVAVNMDTGYGDLLTEVERRRVLAWASEEHAGAGADAQFIAGALPRGGGREPWRAYARAGAEIAAAGGVPILFPSPAFAKLDDAGLVRLFREAAAAAEHFLAFELGTMFNPHGRMFSERVWRALLDMPQCLGVKHSSLRRDWEWERLRWRDRQRPGFAIYSGNDLAADMIEYGSDYLLGLSTFAPELFAARDRAWEQGSAGYLELRDMVQYLGWAGFRAPVPAYKHAAAIFLKLTGGLEDDSTHPRAPRREAWDRALLADAAERMRQVCPEAAGTPRG